MAAELTRLAALVRTMLGDPPASPPRKVTALPVGTRILVGVLLLLALGACHARPVSGIPGGAASTANPNPMPTLSQPAKTAPRRGLAVSRSSYSAKYASHTRNSRVPVHGRPLSALHRVVSLEAAPRWALTNDAGDHVVLDYGERYEVRTADGAITAHDRK